MNLRHKYKAIRVEHDGIKFDSKAEAGYYEDLKTLKDNGDIVVFLRQVPFYLPGGVKYIVDFVEFWKDGEVRFTDVKGFATASFKAKKKQVEILFAPIKIDVVQR